MEVAHCNVCGSPDYDVVFPAGRAQINQVVKCKSCGLMFSWPRTHAVDEDVVAEYDPAFMTELMSRHDPRRSKEEHQVIDYEVTRKRLAERFPKRGKLLEIGSSLGFLSKFFRDDGWDVTGLDPDPMHSWHAREVLKIPVHTCILPDAKFADEQFDAVLMMHVIEHVPDPKDTLREIRRILKPGGVLVMETPRYDSLAFALLRHRERSVSCDGHIFFFTTKTLERVSRDAGFDVDHLDIVGRSMSLERLSWNLGVMSKSQGVARTIKKMSNAMNLQDKRVTLNARDMQRIYLHKPA